MTETEVRLLLSELVGGSASVDEVLARLKQGPLRTEQLSFATLDHHRSLRQVLGEVVFGEGKTAEQVVHIAEKLAAGERVAVPPPPTVADGLRETAARTE